jgi:hypothetical protein
MKYTRFTLSFYTCAIELLSIIPSLAVDTTISDSTVATSRSLTQTKLPTEIYNLAVRASISGHFGLYEA